MCPLMATRSTLHGRTWCRCPYARRERVAIGSEQVLFQLPASSSLYGISPDGRRFLVGRQVDPQPVPGIRVVLNWFEELKGRDREK